MQWIPTFTLFLFLYPLGWLISYLYYVFQSEISSNDLSIIGTIITFLLFLLLLPSWAKSRWGTNNLWSDIGLDFKYQFKAIKTFLNGFIWSFFLLLIFLLFIFFCGWVKDFNFLGWDSFLNSVVLILGIVFAEEIIFRVWLLEEMVLLFGLKRGIIFQSLIFSLAHYRSDIGLLALIPFFSGLFFFGLVLTLRKTIDRGSLMGCIGFHGGLVGIWYLIDAGLITFSIETPYYFLGPSREMINPIGSIFGISILLIIIFVQRRLFARTGRFLISTVKASFRDEIP